MVTSLAQSDSFELLVLTQPTLEAACFVWLVFQQLVSNNHEKQHRKMLQTTIVSSTQLYWSFAVAQNATKMVSVTYLLLLFCTHLCVADLLHTSTTYIVNTISQLLLLHGWRLDVPLCIQDWLQSYTVYLILLYVSLCFFCYLYGIFCFLYVQHLW